MAIYAGAAGHLDDLDSADVQAFEISYLKLMADQHPEVAQEITEKKKLNDELNKKMDDAITTFKKAWQPARTV